MENGETDSSLDSGMYNTVTLVTWAISIVLLVAGFVGLVVGAYGIAGTLCMLGSVAFMIGFGFMVYHRRTTTSS